MLVLFEDVDIGDGYTWSSSFTSFHGIFSSEEKMIEYLFSISKEASVAFYYVDACYDEVVNTYVEEDGLSYPYDRRTYFNKWGVV